MTPQPNKAAAADPLIARFMRSMLAERNVSANTVDGKRLYGSVGISDILAAIEANRGIKLERSQIELEDSLKEIGEYEPTIDLGHGVNVRFKITILDEGAAQA